MLPLNSKSCSNLSAASYTIEPTPQDNSLKPSKSSTNKSYLSHITNTENSSTPFEEVKISAELEETEINIEKETFISFGDKIKDMIGEDNINKLNDKLDEFIDNNTEVSDIIKKIGATTVKNLPFEAKLIIATAVNILSDPDIDKLDLTNNAILNLIFFAIVTWAAGANCYVLADQNQKIGYKEILAAQYTTLLTVISFVILGNKLSKEYNSLIECFNEAFNKQPSDSSVTNFFRAVRGLCVKIKALPTKSAQANVGLAISLLMYISAPMLAYMYAGTDYQNAITGIRNVFEQMGVQDKDTLDFISKTGYLNLVTTMTLGFDIFHQIGNYIGDNAIKFTLSIYNMAFINSPEKKIKNLEEKNIEEKGNFVSKVIEESLINSLKSNNDISEINIDSLLDTIKNDVVSGLGKKKAVESIKQTMEGIALSQDKKEKFICNYIMECFRSSSRLIGAILGGIIGSTVYAGGFGGSLVVATYFDALNMIGNMTGEAISNLSDLEEGYAIQYKDGTIVPCSDVMQCVRQCDISEMYKPAGLDKQVGAATASNQRANSLQGIGIMIFFCNLVGALSVQGCTLIKKHIEMNRAGIIEGKSRLQRFSDSFHSLADSLDLRKPKNRRELIDQIATHGTRLGIAVTAHYYMENIMATEEASKAYFELQGNDLFADNSKACTSLLALSLSIFLIAGFKQGPCVIKGIPSMLSTSAKKIIGYAKCFVHAPGQIINFFAKRIESRKANVVDLELHEQS